MSIKVTREQVSAARIVHALDQAEGRQSDEWIMRLINAKEPAAPTPARSPAHVGRAHYVGDMDLARLSDHDIGHQMQMLITHERRIGEVEEREVEQWWVTGSLDATYPYGDGDDTDVIDVVRVNLVRFSLGNPLVWTLLDGLDGDLAVVGSAVLDFDTGDLAEAVAEYAGVGGHLLILHSVVCDARFAGRHIGRWVAAEAIQALSPGIELVAAVAGPLNSNSEGVERAQISAKLRDVWASIGFVELDGDVMVLIPDLMTTYSSLENLRERFGLSAGLK